jgi:phage tail-like protein
MKQDEIQQLLPVIFQRTLSSGSPLTTILEVMEQMHSPAEAVLDNLDAYFDPRRTPSAFVPFLARWLDLERLFDVSVLRTAPDRATAAPTSPISTGLSSLRELTAVAAELSRWRGTAKGLLLFLETAMETRGFVVEDQVVGNNGRVQPFHLKIRAPAITRPHQTLMERIIESEKPAYVTYELEFFQPPGA